MWRHSEAQAQATRRVASSKRLDLSKFGRPQAPFQHNGSAAQDGRIDASAQRMHCASNCRPLREVASRRELTRTATRAPVTCCHTAMPRHRENERVHSEGWVLAVVWSSMPRRPPTGRPTRARFLAKTLR